VNKILIPEKAIELSRKLREKGEKIVLAGGCFDILHIGHLTFLRNAKKQGAKLIIFLENDENVTKLKGKGRPIHKQLERAKILSFVPSVDYVVLLSDMKNSEDYAKLINQIRPNVIATTNDDPYIKDKTKQAGSVGAKLVPVVKRLKKHSTTKLAKLIKSNL
jgi:FAD synthetase